MCNSQLACLLPVCGFPVQLNCGLPLLVRLCTFKTLFPAGSTLKQPQKNKILASRSFQSIFAVAYVVILSRIKLYQSQIESRKNLIILNGFLLWPIRGLARIQNTNWPGVSRRFNILKMIFFSRNKYSKTSICISEHTYKSSVPSKTWISPKSPQSPTSFPGSSPTRSRVREDPGNKFVHLADKTTFIIHHTL